MTENQIEENDNDTDLTPADAAAAGNVEAETAAAEPAPPAAAEQVEFPPISKQSLEQINQCFAPCGRCGYFWVAFRVLAGEGLATAVQETGDNWLQLRWYDGVRDLLHKSFGSRTDIDHEYFAGTCPECRRDFLVTVLEEDPAAMPEFRIRLLPG